MHDLRLARGRRVVDPVVEAAALERVVQLARPVRGHDDERPPLRRDRAELGDRNLEVRQELEQERLELVVGAIDLVDQEHDGLARLERVEERPSQQEALGVEGLRLGGSTLLGRVRSDGTSCAQVQQLARVVPVVERVVEVDALVALEPDQARAGGGGERLADLGLAHSRLTLEQQRLLERDREEDGDGEAPVGEVALARQGLLDGCWTLEAQCPAASSSARRVSTRARCRL